MCLLIGSVLSKDDVSLPSQEYLGKSVVEFRPTPRHTLVSVPLKTLTQRSQDFLQQYVLLRWQRYHLLAAVAFIAYDKPELFGTTFSLFSPARPFNFSAVLDPFPSLRQSHFQFQFHFPTSRVPDLTLIPGDIVVFRIFLFYKTV